MTGPSYLKIFWNWFSFFPSLHISPFKNLDGNFWIANISLLRKPTSRVSTCPMLMKGIGHAWKCLTMTRVCPLTDHRVEVAMLPTCLLLLVLCTSSAAASTAHAGSCSKYEFPYELRANGKFYRWGKRDSRNLRTFYIKLAREIIRQLKSIFLRNRELSNVWSDFFYNDDFTWQVPTRPAVLQWDFVDLLWTRRQACRVSGGGWRGGLQGNIPWVSLHSIPSHQAKKDF